MDTSAEIFYLERIVKGTKNASHEHNVHEHGKYKPLQDKLTEAEI